MLAKYLAVGLALAAFAAKGVAQSPTTPPQTGVPNTSPPDTASLRPPFLDSAASATQSTARFLEALQELLALQPTPKAATPVRKACPMPVHRPDTSRLERMRVARPSPSVAYPMPRAELKCDNPLDTAK